ncbi:MAG: hypothetical protein N4A62_11355 [Marinisporobacter sp.]|nr:hypothetical protein [Marinisporobacter sp.]
MYVNRLLKSWMSILFTDNVIILLKFVSYGHFPEPPALSNL